MTNGIILSGSAKIYYELHGDDNKDVLVLLHGNGESSKHFKNHINILAKSYKLLLIDSRGHGQSEFGKGALSLSTMVIDLVNILEHLQLTNVNIAGFSDGANIAMLLAIKYPDLVNKLILISGNCNRLGFNIITNIMLQLGYISSSISGVIDPYNRLNKEYFSLMVKEPALKIDTLRLIKSNTLVINGNKDMITQSHAKKMAKTIPNGSLKIVKGDHFWIYRQPEEACQIISEFIND